MSTELIINLTNIKTSAELHTLLMEKLNFPSFYGRNWDAFWDAFWDAITGLIEMPESITFIGWSELLNTLTNDAEILQNLLRKYCAYYGEITIIYMQITKKI